MSGLFYFPAMPEFPGNFEEIPRKFKSEYGEQILPTLSAKLTPEYGQGFGRRNLARQELERLTGR